MLYFCSPEKIRRRCVVLGIQVQIHTGLWQADLPGHWGDYTGSLTLGYLKSFDFALLLPLTNIKLLNKENDDVLLKDLDSLKKSLKKEQEYFSKEIEKMNNEMKVELNDLGKKISEQFETALQATESEMINANDEVKKKITELREEFNTYQNISLAKKDEAVEQLSDANKKLQMNLGSVSEEFDKLQKKNLQMKWSIGVLLFLMVSFFIFHFYGEMLVKQ